MSGNKNGLGNAKVLVIAVAMFIITALCVFYAMRQDYGLQVTVQVNQSSLNSDFCAVILIANYHNNMTHLKVVDGKLSFKIPAATHSVLLMNIADHNSLNMIQNNIIDWNLIENVSVNGNPVDQDNLLKAIEQTRDRMYSWFILVAVLAGLIVSGAIYGGYYLYCRKQCVNSVISTADIRLRGFLKPAVILFRNPKFRFVFLVVLAIVVLIWRKPGQLWYPNIFIEDSDFILHEYMLYGMQSLFMSVNGYFITISRVINILAFKISFWYYAEIAAFLANLFILLVILAIAYAPTYLKWPYLCAVMTLLLKTGSECFGVALYTFWWAGLLIVLAVLWQSGKRPVLRIVFLIVGGLSSPIVFVAAPLLVFLAAYKRNRGDIAAAITIVIVCVIQIFPVLAFSGGQHEPLSRPDVLIAVIRTIFGSYTFLQTNSYWLLLVCGMALIIILITHLKFYPKSFKGFIDSNLYYLLLLAWLGGAVLSSMYRVNWTDTDRYPLSFYEHRYYFYPFVFLTWLNVWIIAELPNLYPKIVLKAFMLLVLFNFVFGGAWKAMPMQTPDIGWQQQLAYCITGQYDNIITVANSQMVRFYNMSAEDCRKMVANSLFFNDVKANLVRLNR